MHRTKSGLGSAVGAVLVSLAVQAGAAEVKVTEVPAPVLKAMETRFPGIKIVGTASEVTPEGQTVYEVTLDDKGKNIDTMVTPEGALTLIEREITRKDLPKEVQTTLNAKFTKNRYKFVEQCIEVKGTDEKVAYYEVLLESLDTKQLRAVQLGTDGAVQKVEKKAAGGEDD